MELYPVNGQAFMFDAHDFALVIHAFGPGRYVKNIFIESLRIDQQAMVSGRHKRIGDSAEQAISAVVYVIGFAMHQLTCPYDCRAERFTN